MNIKVQIFREFDELLLFIFSLNLIMYVDRVRNSKGDIYIYKIQKLIYLVFILRAGIRAC